ncbi:hypothetical protein L873DRAFT_1830221 [Choiromyces venosus 120613-1]|uniref:Uncharacterized protein n=1 Tax=Choiromyces venosus 120613-1 TaxID=1336337 RepID=A0A3N4JBN3_9PEZI|nr:hypothetical protein L873DRAFT_1830221 [Choiromyces venosus 120613-1]
MGIVRLHITPLTQETAHTLLPPKVLADKAVVASMSFHTIPSFPKKSYGYLDCERGVADGIKKKLNGSLFRGVKVRVEDARRDTFVPGGIPSDGEEVDGGKKTKKEKRKRAKKDDDDGDDENDGKKKSKKNKKEKGVINGIELKDRKVQRGWSRPPTIATAVKSDSKRECLFRTSAATTSTLTVSTSTEKPTEKTTKKKKTANTIKEFTHNTKFPQFLKGTSLDKDLSTTTATFDESLGWLDSAGTIIEAAPAATSSTASSSTPSTTDSDSESDISPITPKTPPTNTTKRSKAPAPTLQITIPRIVHPLEALYKPTTATPYSSAISPTNTSFRFGFGSTGVGVNNEDEDEDMLSGDDESQQPTTATMTSSTPPYRYRSAAPTPDTAIGHRKFFPPEEDEVPDLSGGAAAGRLFVPSTPRVIGSISMGSGSEAERRGGGGGKAERGGSGRRFLFNFYYYLFSFSFVWDIFVYIIIHDLYVYNPKKTLNTIELRTSFRMTLVTELRYLGNLVTGK